MTNEQAAEKAARFKALINEAEGLAEEALAASEALGTPRLSDKIRTLRRKVRHTHNAANEVAKALAQTLGGELTAFSGGDDKPELP